jgi:hypothetical protein
MSDKTNPNNVGFVGSYAGFVAPKRADQSTVGPGGNTVDRAAINRTVTSVSKNATPAFPCGVPSKS